MLLDQLTKPEKTSMRPTIVDPTRYIMTTWRYEALHVADTYCTVEKHIGG